MKKIVALGAIAALAGGMIFADEPAIDMKVAEFNGNATVKWGMDLDAGQHGFENSTGDTNLKVNLWNEGTKATEGDGIWGEIEIKGKGLAVKNGAFDGDGTVSVEKALIHLGDKAYIGIKSGDTQVGAYKFDGAIRSADNDNAKWLSDVGPKGFSEGIVLGYGDDNFGVDVDLRSYKSDNTNYTSAYSIAAEAKLKDSNEFVSGLAVDAGVAYNLSGTYNDKDKDTGKLVEFNSVKYDNPFEATKDDVIKEAEEYLAAGKAEAAKASSAFAMDPNAITYGTKKSLEDGVADFEKKLAKAKDAKDADAAMIELGWASAPAPAADSAEVAAAKAALKTAQKNYDAYKAKLLNGATGYTEAGLDNTTDETDTTSMQAIINAKQKALDNILAEEAAAKAIADAKAAIEAAKKDAEPTKVNVLGYNANASYKFEIDDTYYVKPAVGFTGSVTTVAAKDNKTTINQNSLVAGVLFGWGANADANAGVPFLDGDSAKKVTPGVSVVAAIPLASTVKGEKKTEIYNSACTAVIVPSVYLGDLVENLKFAAYSEIALLKNVDPADQEKVSGDTTTYNASCANKDRTTAMAVAAGLAYDVKSDDLTITPKAGIRYVNAAYVENKISDVAPLSTNKVFDGLGIAGKDEKGNNNYFNLKAGVDVNGLIANTTLFAEYTSANLLNDNEYKDVAGNTQKMYNVKLGTFNIGAKIHF